ncbi:MAG: hypothetical protein ABIH37_04775 [archaeon]
MAKEVVEIVKSKKDKTKFLLKDKPSKPIADRKLDSMFWILLIALIALPLAGTLIHIKLHNETYPWLIYITLFDVIVISLMYLFRKTIFSGFILNTVLFVTGVIAHLTVAGGWSDVLLAIPDFSIGYVLWRLYK